MKDCVWFRAMLYFMIACLPPFIAELSKYTSFQEISPVAKTIIVANCILQGIIAVRAFADQSISRASTDRKPKKVELINEQTK